MSSEKAETTRILHPTDLTRNGVSAFAHALAFALKTRRALSLLHVTTASDPAPRKTGHQLVVETLIRWSVLCTDAGADAPSSELDLDVASASVPARTVREGILDHLDTHPYELAVLATESRKGKSHWRDAALERSALRKAQTMILFLRDGQRGFVDAATGEIRLRKVLIPIDDRIDFTGALTRIVGFVDGLGDGVEKQLLYVGANPPATPCPDMPILVREGPVAETILKTALHGSFDLIAMPTAGRHGLLDAFRGSVTAEILDAARWPVLSVPAG